jgi:hypothetical protein
MKLIKTTEIYKNNNIQHNHNNIEFKEYKKNVYSQCGEDGILQEIFNRIKDYNTFFIEFGGWDGEHLSNSANLRINYNWDGILFEGHCSKITDKKINIYHEYITSININYIFEKYKIPKNFGLLSIDIDGDDAYVFEALDTNKFSPSVIVCEYNPGLPNHIPLKCQERQPNWSYSDIEKGYFGGNLNCFYDIAKKKNYEFVTTTDSNVIFVKSELFSKLNIEKKEKQYLMENHSYQSAHDFWKNLIVNHEMDFVTI